MHEIALDATVSLSPDHLCHKASCGLMTLAMNPEAAVFGRHAETCLAARDAGKNQA